MRDYWSNDQHKNSLSLGLCIGTGILWERFILSLTSDILANIYSLSVFTRYLVISTLYVFFGSIIGYICYKYRYRLNLWIYGFSLSLSITIILLFYLNKLEVGGTAKKNSNPPY